MTAERDFDATPYVRWRNAVYRRDKWTCRMPGCNSARKMTLNAHHIQRWADAPGLRYEVGNGITLCRSCHEKVTGKEDEYAPIFTKLLAVNKSDAAMLLLMRKYDSGE